MPHLPFTIVEVFYYNGDATDQELVDLANAKLPYLQSIKFHRQPQITEAGLSAIAKGYPRLKRLSITGLTQYDGKPRLSPEQLLPVLEEFNGLESIDIILARSTDAEAWCLGLSKLESLRQLKFLYRPLGEAASHLASLPNLEDLELYSLPLSDEDVQYLTRLRNLRVLRLRGVSDISAVGLHQLKKFPALEKLMVSKPHLRDQMLLGSVSLADLRALAGEAPGFTIEVEENGQMVAIIGEESRNDEATIDSGL